MRLRRLALPALFSMSLLFACTAHATAGPAEPADPQCNRPGSYNGYSTIHCPIWKTHAPALVHPGTGSVPSGWLERTGYANWFWCQSRVQVGGHTWAYTIADNGYAGWLSGYYYSGGSPNWPSSLRTCSASEMAAFYNP